MAEDSKVLNLIGQWEGKWSGDMVHPMEMKVTAQDGSKITGAATFTTRRWGRQTFPMEGQIGSKGGTLYVIVTVKMSGHSDKFEFTTVSRDKLEGVGHGMRHTGPVTLTRR